MLNYYKRIDLVLLAYIILDKLEKSREHAAQGMYKDATEVSHDMRAKYGL